MNGLITHNAQFIGGIGKEAANKISDYLLTGMHYTTSEAQIAIEKIIISIVEERIDSLTPSEFHAAYYLHKKTNEKR